MNMQWRDGLTPQDLFARTPETWKVERARTMLETHGFFEAGESYFAAGTELLRDYLSALTIPEKDELAVRIHRLAKRPRPDLPNPSTELSAVQGAAAFLSVPELTWVNPRRVFTNKTGYESFIHDQSDAARDQVTNGQGALPTPAQDQVGGVSEFAHRIASERGSLNGLVELFGPESGLAFIDLYGWNTPLGAVFVINTNGNHRTTALAALEAPCVLADVTWCYGPFDTSPGQSSEEDDTRVNYRTLLHAYGVASFPDPQDFLRNYSGVITDWPILIDTPDVASASLRAMEALADRQEEAIGRLPRDLFDDPTKLDHLGREVRARLTDVPDIAAEPQQPRAWWRRNRT